MPRISSQKPKMTKLCDKWKKEWKGMPEYNQDMIMPHGEIIIRFKTAEDEAAFWKLIKQDKPNKLKSAWYPKAVRVVKPKQVYTSES